MKGAADRFITLGCLIYVIFVITAFIQDSHFIKDAEILNNGKIVKYNGLFIAFMNNTHEFRWSEKEVGTYRTVDTCFGGTVKRYGNISIASNTICGRFDIKTYYKK